MHPCIRQHVRNNSKHLCGHRKSSLISAAQNVAIGLQLKRDFTVADAEGWARSIERKREEFDIDVEEFRGLLTTWTSSMSEKQQSTMRAASYNVMCISR